MNKTLAHWSAKIKWLPDLIKDVIVFNEYTCQVQICRAAPDISALSCLQAAVQPWLLPSTLPVAYICRANPNSRMPNSSHFPFSTFISTACHCLVWCLRKRRSWKEKEIPAPWYWNLRVYSGFSHSLCIYLHIHAYLCMCVHRCIYCLLMCTLN